MWGSLIKFRREFDQYVSLRPVRLFAGVPCPLANRKAGHIDFVIVRENTEGEYSSVGGMMFEGTEREVVMQQAVFTRHGTDRLLRAGAWLRARHRRQRHRQSDRSDLVSRHDARLPGYGTGVEHDAHDAIVAACLKTARARAT